MRNARRTVTVVVLATSLLVLTALAATSQAALRGYLVGQAVEALHQERTVLTRLAAGPGAGMEEDDNTIEEVEEDLDSNVFSGAIQYLPTSSSYTQVGVAPEPSSEQILHFCRSNAQSLARGEVLEMDVGGSHYVVAQASTSSLEIVSPSVGDEVLLSDVETATADIQVLYIDTAPISQLSNRLAVATLVALGVLGGCMYLVGMSLGRRVESVQAQQSAFFQNASHELKTPLMSIQGYAEGIATGVIDTRHAADVILDESQRMTELVEEVLALSRIETTRHLCLEQVDLHELLYDCLRSLEAVLEQRGITVSVMFPSAPVTVTADETQLRRALSNLLTNALRYAATTVTVSCQEVGPQVEVAVTDDGAGLDEETLDHLFDRFYIGPSGSTGIGLALAKEVIDLHHGRISARNTGEGTRFEVLLPLGRRRRPRRRRHLTPGTRPPGTGSSGRPTSSRGCSRQDGPQSSGPP